jgi:hypothetical protein
MHGRCLGMLNFGLAPGKHFFPMELFFLIRTFSDTISFLNKKNGIKKQEDNKLYTWKYFHLETLLESDYNFEKGRRGRGRVHCKKKVCHFPVPSRDVTD